MKQISGVRAQKRDEAKPDAPSRGDYVVVSADWDDWYKIGRVHDDGSVDAMHTRRPEIRTFDSLKLVGVSSKAGRPCWVPR